MFNIIIEDIEGDLEEFLYFMEAKADEEKNKDSFKVTPKFQTDGKSLGAEITAIILSGINVLIPFIIFWLESKQKQEKKGKIKFKAKIKKGDKTLNIGGDSLTLEEIKEILEFATE